jgi:hypothetical protein
MSRPGHRIDYSSRRVRREVNDNNRYGEGHEGVVLGDQLLIRAGCEWFWARRGIAPEAMPFIPVAHFRSTSNSFQS